MAIPPFPSQDLAKLVLGYLAEEQLMTAYDEFLQASPYLDALRNEYDRIFMTSLKNILSEYRAVKIYIETCKPYLLRKQLFQCTNLLEVVKYLIQHVDTNKIQGQDGNNGKTSVDILNSSTNSRRSQCEVCRSINLTSCTCKIQQSSGQYTNQSIISDKTNLQSSVETTSLIDLPGNSVTTRKKYVKVLEKEPTSSYSSCEHSETIAKPSLYINSDQNLTDSSLLVKNDHNNISTQDSMHHFSSSRKVGLESSQKIEEFNEILNKVCANNSTVVGRDKIDIRLKEKNSESDINKSISVVPTFQDFSAGVKGVNNVLAIVPDSSTSKIDNLRSSFPKETSSSQNLESSHIEANSIKSQIGNKSTVALQPKPQERAKANNSNITGNLKLRPKQEDHRIRILSDIKVDSTKTKSTKTNLKVFPVLKNSTSTPLLQMQTIFINGTPAYKPNSQSGPYTKDEIMAMPTIILVPNSGPSVSSISSQPKMSLAQNTTTVCNTTSDVKLPSLEPLTIDISNSPEPATNNLENVNILQNVENSSITRENSAPHQILHHTAPKNDAIVKISTPQTLPLPRKSSSTPRRTSHVRVLDFTTPRRILHETISEQHSGDSGATESSITDTTANKQLLVATNIQDDTKAIKSKQDNSSSNNSKQAKENTNTNNISVTKKHNWDSDLRALVASKPEYKDDSSTKVKPKISKKKKIGEKKNKSLSNNKKTIPKSKTNKKKIKNSEVISEDESVEVVEKVVDVAVKPTINIISDRMSASHQENDKIQNTSNYEEEVNTPDLDRLSLHNAIDAKLNISDLLETPYKQALYDIQMETPRFLDPDIPVEPMSDIKISNIPTPRFLTTPSLSCTSNPAQATPSSYSSRPTDYSSGGSYYKPDDQDYLRISEDVSYSIQSSKSTVNLKSPKKPDDDCSETTSPVKSSRPVRQCRKNVCYYNTPSAGSKSKDYDYKIETASSCSDSISIYTPHENKDDKEKCRTVLSDNKAKVQNKSASKRRTNVSKRKSPLKKGTSKNFMKIKPRRLTPSKENLSKRKSKENELKEKIGNKEKPANIMPSVASIPTKSRRKSSTPRKLQQTSTTKTYHSEVSCIDTDTSETPKSKKNDTQNSVQDSDTEQIALQWSDDGTQDCKQKDVHTNVSVNDSEDISKIQEYIQTTEFNKPANVTDTEDSLQNDLIKRGFDAETAKIIERDLLDTPSYVEQRDELVETKISNTCLNRTIESDCSTSTNLQIVQEDDQLELSVHACNEGSDNYVVFEYNDTKGISGKSPVKLKDTFSMEVCIDDDVCIRLRAMPFISLLDHNPQKDENKTKYEHDCRETETAVASISRSEMLNTPIKEATKAQCYEIFDSTLTSIDTPLKQNSPEILKSETTTVTEIVLEVEQIEDKVELKERTESKKRKRIQSESSSEESLSDIKKAKSETQYLLNSASIQNIDIESVLSKLHGP